MPRKLSLLLVLSIWLIGVLFTGFAYLLIQHKQIKQSHCCYMSLEFYGIYHLVYCAAYVTVGFIIPSIVMILLYSYTTKQLFIHRTLVAKNPFRNPGKYARHHCQTTTNRQRIADGSVNSTEASSKRNTSNSICVNVKMQNDKSRNGKKPHPKNTRVNSAMAGKLKESKLLVVLVILVLLSVTPYFTLTLILSTGHWASIQFPDHVYISLLFLTNINGFVSPLLCGFGNKRIRRAIPDELKQRLILNQMTMTRCCCCNLRQNRAADPEVDEISFVSTTECFEIERTLSVSSRTSTLS